MQYNTILNNILLHIAQVFSSAHTDDGASCVHFERRSPGQLSVRDGEEERQRQEGGSADRPAALTGQDKTREERTREKRIGLGDITREDKAG
jgi:hypothetical protein